MVVREAIAEGEGEDQLWLSVWPRFRYSWGSSLRAPWVLISASICCDNLRLRLFSAVTHVGSSPLLFVSVRTRLFVPSLFVPLIFDPLHPRLDLDDQGRLELAIGIVVFVQHTIAAGIDGTVVRPYDRCPFKGRGGSPLHLVALKREL